MLSSLKKEDKGKEFAEEKTIEIKSNKTKQKSNSLEKEKQKTSPKKKSSTKKNKQVIHDKKEKEIKTKENKKKRSWKNLFTKKNITFFILFLLDILLVIYSANKNIVNYVTISNQDIFVSKTKYLLWGRNYINIIITAFFYLYICLINRFFLNRKNTKKFLIWLLVILVLLNMVLFCIFTKRIY